MKLNKLRSKAVVSSQKVEKIATLTPEQLDIIRGGICIYLLHSSDPK